MSCTRFPISLIILLVAFSSVTAGCGSGNAMGSTAVNKDGETSFGNGGEHVIWGLWQFVADPDSGTLDITSLRNASMHLNALPFLEPPPFTFLTLESLEFNGDIIEADIGLRHPFLGLTQFTGFDVCGVLITNGSVTGFSDSNLRMAGENDTRLLNADGYSRWWNPAEFPVNNGSIFSYTDGLLGTPDSYADYNCTLNGYKYFCDNLEPDGSLDSVLIADRGIFSAGQKNIRHYTIKLGDDGLVFNYTVDASWAFPTGDIPWQVPDDFPPNANRPEAWRMSVTEIENTLWNDGSGNGGGLTLQIDVYDWYDADLNTVLVESPGSFDMVESLNPIGGGEGYSTYEIEISGATPDEGDIDLLISVACEKSGYGGFLPGNPIAAYFTCTAEVEGEQIFPFKNIPLRDDAEARDIAIDHQTGDLLVLYGDNTIYKYEKADSFANGYEFAAISPNDCDPRYIDIAPNQYFIVFVEYYSTDEVITARFYDPKGDFIKSIDHHPDGPQDVAAFTGGDYKNDLCSVLGVSSPGYIITDVPRYADGIWVPAAAYHDYYIYDNIKEGIDKVFYGYVKGVESDLTGDFLWFLEDPDYYASRWALYNIGSKGYLEFDKAYFGTGSQTDDDNGWNNAKDITRDDQNRYFVLDELSTGVARVKMWTIDGNTTTSEGGFGDSATISGTPLRIEGSDFDGDIVVLHGDTPPHMISLFLPSEMPGG